MPLLVTAVQLVTRVCDYIAWPVMLLLGYGQQRLEAGSEPMAKQVDENDPESPWRCVESFDNLQSASSEFENAGDMLMSAAAKHPHRRCLGTREVIEEHDEKQPNGRVFKKLSLGEYRWETYAEVRRRVERLGRGLLRLGLRPGQRLLLFAETRAEWQICCNAALRYNFPLVTLYATLGDEALVYGVDQSEVELIVTSEALVGKVKSLLARMPRVRHVVYMTHAVLGVDPDVGDVSGLSAEFRPMTEVERLGADDDDAKEPERPAGHSDVAVIMYTSGSTGLPKGVMISHANLLATAASAVARIRIGDRDSDVYIGYLPLAHVLELLAELACLQMGVPIGFSSPLTLSDQSNKIKRGTRGDVSVLRPTLMAAVPAIMDRVSKNVWEKVNEGGEAKRQLFNWAFEHKQELMLQGRASPLLDLLVFKQVKQLLGGRLRMMLSGGAPLSPETQRFMNVCFGVPILQGYGLTETTGAAAILTSSDTSTGTTGAPLTCCQIRLRDWQEGGYTCRDSPRPRGEVLIGGSNITIGYFNMPDKTREDFFVDDNGVRWFCSGDIGEMGENGSLSIIDRKKDLVKLQGGEYISLGKVETALGVSAYVEQLCVYGDSYKDHTVVLVVPKQKALQQLADSLGVSADDYESLLKDKRLREAVLKDMQQRAAGKLERFEVPTRLCLVPEQWTPDSGLVTDSLKLKRKPLHDCYRQQIEAMYNE